MAQTEQIAKNYVIEFDVPPMASKPLDEQFAYVQGYVRVFLDALWLSDDHGGFMEKTIILTSDLNNPHRSRTSRTATYNAKCEYKVTNFTFADIGYALRFMEWFLKYPVVIPNAEDLMQSSTQGDNLYTNILLGHYPSKRITRALTLLPNLRNAFFLPARISSAMAILECLFSTGRNNKKEKVSSRTAKFSDREPSVKANYYQVLKEAYNFRSEFVHGGEFSDTKAMISIAESVDDILRMTIRKVMKENPAILEKDDSFIDAYFDSLPMP